MSDALNPTLGHLLALCGLDRRWARGQGVWLFDETGRWFLDAYAQYGAVALGHNAPAPVAALRAALDAAEPAMVQPYRAPHAEALAAELVALAPGDLAHCVFTTSGAEAVEAGVKLVRARTGRPLIVTARGAYHGKTLGALSLAPSSRHAEGFGPFAPGCAQVPWGDAEALAACLEAHPGQVAGVLLEPIQGERGVHLPPDGYLRAARRLCDAHGAALLLDEVQTGLGRTGRLFACEHEGVAPDVLLLAKGLSGGLVPLGACLATPAVWDARFGLGHSSTFANNNLACAVGRAVLRELSERRLPEDAARKGELLRARLERLARRHPRLVAEVRGRGLLCALELRAPEPGQGTFLSALEHHGLYAYAVAGVLARCASLLVAPTLGDAPVLRLAPPLTISDAELELVGAGLEGVFAALEREGARLVVGALADRGARPTSPAPGLAPTIASDPAPLQLPRPRPRRRVDYVFVAHLTRPTDLLLTNPGLALEPDDLEGLCRFVAQLPPVLLTHGPTLRSPTGAEVEGAVVLLPLLPADLRRHGARETCARIRRAVELAAGLGAQVVGLGGHTTPFTRHGRAVRGLGPRITTGNALTAGVAVAATRARLAARGLALDEATLAVVGAAGSVGGLCARLLARAGARRLLLVGNPASGIGALERLRARLARSGCEVAATTDLARLEEAAAILAATASNGGVLDRATLAPGAIVCDLARPPDAGELLRARADLELFEGGLVHLPDPTASFGPGNLVGLPAGVQLACLAETVLLALERVCGAEAGPDHAPDHVGRELSLELVDSMLALAERHGFAPVLGPVAGALDGGSGPLAAPALLGPTLVTGSAKEVA